MNSLVRANILRAILLIALQGLVLQRIQLGWSSFNYLSLLIYPLIVILLPLKTPRITLILIGFVVGILVDIFYGSYGVHAGACVFLCFIRPLILQILEPRGGYPSGDSPLPSLYGLNWFLRYSGIMLVLHLLFYFSLEVFAFAYFGQILLKTLISFVISYLAISAYILIFNPKA